MDVISFCIIPGKKAAVFKDILSTLHILVQYYKEHAPKENYCLIRVFSSTVTFKRFMHIIDWLISLSAFDNVETQGESNLITIRFSFSNQVKKKCNFWILKRKLDNHPSPKISVWNAKYVLDYMVLKTWHFTRNVWAHRPFCQPQILLFMMADIS